MEKKDLSKIKWGEIYTCDLGTMKGSVQCGVLKNKRARTSARVSPALNAARARTLFISSIAAL